VIKDDDWVPISCNLGRESCSIPTPVVLPQPTRCPGERHAQNNRARSFLGYFSGDIHLLTIRILVRVRRASLVLTSQPSTRWDTPEAKSAGSTFGKPPATQSQRKGGEQSAVLFGPEINPGLVNSRQYPG